MRLALSTRLALLGVTSSSAEVVLGNVGSDELRKRYQYTVLKVLGYIWPEISCVTATEVAASSPGDNQRRGQNRLDNLLVHPVPTIRRGSDRLR